MAKMANFVIIFYHNEKKKLNNVIYQIFFNYTL